MEDRKGVILQAHLDMVPQKNNVRRGARDADDLREMFPDKRRFQRDQITVHNIEV